MKQYRELMKYPFYIRFCIILLLLALVLFFLEEAQELFIPLIIAILLSFILLPLARKLEKLHMPRWAASLASVFIGLLLFGVVIYFLLLQLQSFGNDLPNLKDNIVGKINAIEGWIGDTFNISEKDQVKWLDKRVAEIINAGDKYLISFFAITGILLTNMILIPLYAYFLILYREKIRRFISIICSNGEEERAFLISHQIVMLTQKYLKRLLIDVSIIATILSIAFLLLGIKHAILFAALISILNLIIPYMGIAIGSILPFLMAVVTFDSFGSALIVIIVGICLQFIDNHLINPYIVGSSVSINPLTALLALVIGALVWGLYGMLLCIPVTGMIKVICDNVDSLKPYGYIIGHEKTDIQRKRKGKETIEATKEELTTL